MIWEQLQESDKRERVLKQELVATQTSLSRAEMQIESQNLEIKNLEAEKCRLMKFKASKVDRMKDLEDKVKKIDVFEAVDGDKLISALTKKDAKLAELSKTHLTIDDQIHEMQRRHDQELAKFKRELLQEKIKSSQIVDKMD